MQRPSRHRHGKLLCLLFFCLASVYFPFALAQTAVPFAIDSEATLVFTGDLMQHSPQYKRARQADGSYDYSACFEEVAPLIAGADLAVGNLEVTLGGEPYSGYPCFSAPDDWLYALRDIGFDLLTTSNNHCLDRGRNGVLRTLDVADSAGVSTLGTYRDDADRAARYPLLVEVNGIRFVFLAATYGTNGFSVPAPCRVNALSHLPKEDYTYLDELEADIAAAHALHPDVLIAIMHWGYEYKLQPSRVQRELADWLLDHGVDHIIGGHPHVIQPTELVYDDYYADPHLVAYSQGNFISNMSAPNTDTGTLLTLRFRKVGFVTRLVDIREDIVRCTRPDYRLVIED